MPMFRTYVKFTAACPVCGKRIISADRLWHGSGRLVSVRRIVHSDEGIPECEWLSVPVTDYLKWEQEAYRDV